MLDVGADGVDVDRVDDGGRRWKGRRGILIELGAWL
jgi:hypothetical protein